MRNISFSLTTPQVRAGTKDITRRDGWATLKPGTRLMACEKCQGLGKGGKIVKIREIEVLSVEREQLREIVERPMRGPRSECEREGFPDMTPTDFMWMFCKNMGVVPDDYVTRIEFTYV
jgi:hypothetical protein